MNIGKDVMSNWIVETVTDIETIEAVRPFVDTAGYLELSNAEDEVVAIYARNAWVSVARADVLRDGVVEVEVEEDVDVEVDGSNVFSDEARTSAFDALGEYAAKGKTATDAFMETKSRLESLGDLARTLETVQALLKRNKTA